MVRCLLYSAGLLPRFWSAALVHAVYLKNRLYHKALCTTPHEAWTGYKPCLAHLRSFGALVTAIKPGKRPAKADRHTSHGVLLGYGSTPKHVRYFYQTTNREKLSTHHTIDEAHYGKTTYSLTSDSHGHGLRPRTCTPSVYHCAAAVPLSVMFVPQLYDTIFMQAPAASYE
jgi:hypothetical protein